MTLTVPPWAAVSGAHLYGFASAGSALDRDVPRPRDAREAARDSSPRPSAPSPDAVDALHDLVVRAR